MNKDNNEPEQIASPCVACHEKKPGKLSMAVSDWRESVHFKNQVACEGCHGGPIARGDRESCTRGSDAPQDAKVPYLCGQCHTIIKEKHLGSHHGMNVLPNCVTCHSNHKVKPSSVDIINEKRCTKCHSFEVPKKMRDMLIDAAARINKSKANMEKLERLGYNTISLKRLLDEAAKNLTQVNITFHNFDLRELRTLSANIEASSGVIERTLKIVESSSKEKERQKSVAIVLIFFFTAFSLFLLYYKKSIS